jgi:hypothetical protein
MLYSVACAENIRRVPNHGHPPGQISAPVASPWFPLEVYGASAGTAVLGYTVIDYMAGPEDSLLFGKGFGDSAGLLNGNSWFRVGFGWNANIPGMVFRIASPAIGWLLGNSHIDLWNVPW